MDEDVSLTSLNRRKLIYELSNHLKIGIVGTTNVGKSSLFNAFSFVEENRAACGRWLFSTIDANIRTFPVPDERIEWLQGLLKPSKFSRAMISVVDTAGIVAGSYFDVSFALRYI
jgi:ribosome-binding ATPase YchF (GTP1/OBG family)